MLPSGLAAAAETVTIEVGDNWYCSPEPPVDGVCRVEIDLGDTVVWDFSPAAAKHTTTEGCALCAAPSLPPLWDSGSVSPGGTFAFTFDEPGTFSYYDTGHPVEMRGVIVVSGAVGGVAELLDAGNAASLGIEESEAISLAAIANSLAVLAVAGAVLAATALYVGRRSK